jgi:hypothetical protein
MRARENGGVVHVRARSIDEFLRDSGVNAVVAVPIEEVAVGGNATDWVVMHKKRKLEQNSNQR